MPDKNMIKIAEDVGEIKGTLTQFLAQQTKTNTHIDVLIADHGRRIKALEDFKKMLKTVFYLICGLGTFILSVLKVMKSWNIFH